MLPPKKILISVSGPTASGKTRLAIDLALLLKTEILSCDSRQFYREIPIGTAAPDAQELQAAPHHFIGNKSLTEDYSIGQFEKEALSALDSIFQQHGFAVMVGGSGMYEKAVLLGLDDLPQANPQNQEELLAILENEGIESLQNMLKEADPLYFDAVDIQNPRRLIRALDVYRQTGQPYSSFLKRESEERPFRSFRIGIEIPREVLYERINHRVDLMMEQGLLEEAKRVYPLRECKALQTVGYKELFAFFEGKWDLKTAVEEIKKNTRRFAKRQLTWYRKATDIHYIKFGYSQQELVNLLKEMEGFPFEI